MKGNKLFSSSKNMPKPGKPYVTSEYSRIVSLPKILSTMISGEREAQ